jgi:MinD superfamily P-loop ATPase
MILAVASRKGGTGKTTIPVKSAPVLASAVQPLGCDAKEPNGHLFLKGSTNQEETVTIQIPQKEF